MTRSLTEQKIPRRSLKELLAAGDLTRPDELALALKVSPATVYSWTQRGAIPFLRLEKCIRFDPGDIREWLDAKRMPTRKF